MNRAILPEMPTEIHLQLRRKIPAWMMLATRRSLELPLLRLAG
jgi:hypothetical protein